MEVGISLQYKPKWLVYVAPLMVTLILLVAISSAEGKKYNVKPEFLQRRGKKYFFNSCSCGLVEGELQDLA
jgi:hypothetical protein